jgi:NAD(P)-dependent dehydrogenase (short-subunit alcohol dehydrogenase family)
MKTLLNERVVVTGGSRGLGRAMVDALAECGARVTVIARDRERLSNLESNGISVRPGDATDAAVMDDVVADVKPSVLILNAGATPFMAPLHEQTWDSFTAVWNTDVRASLHGIQAALKTALPEGARVFLMSSGAAVAGAPLSGGYAGAKRMLWFMARHANDLAVELGRNVRFHVLVPMQLVGETDLAQCVAGAYASRQGRSIEALLAARYGSPLSLRQFGEYLIRLLVDPRYVGGLAFGLKADTGISILEE